MAVILFFVQGKWCWTEVEKTVVYQTCPNELFLLQKALRLHDTFQLGAMTAPTLCRLHFLTLTITNTDQSGY